MPAPSQPPTASARAPQPAQPKPAQPSEAAFSVGGMTCSSCVASVENAAKSVGGVKQASVNLARGRAVVRFDPKQATPEKIAEAITGAGYPAAPESPGIAAGDVEEDRLQRQMHHARLWLRRAIVGIVLWAPVELIHLGYYFTQGHHPMFLEWVALVTSTISITYVGGAFFASAWSALRRGTSNMDTLIAMGASVAYVYSLVAFLGHQPWLGWWQTLPNLYFVEATGLLALISLGHWLEARARQSAGSAIRELLNLAPATALRLNTRREGEAPAGPTSARTRKLGLMVLRDPGDGSAGASPSHEAPAYSEVPVAQLKVGDRVLVRPGDRIPIDGQVVDGHSSVDESMITGESMPAPRSVGDDVIGGTLNQDGRLVVRATKIGAQTALAQIVQLVETAQSSKPPVQRLADKVAAVFVPIVLAIAVVTGVCWYMWGKTHDWEQARTWGKIANSVCSVLIIACPCALGLAVPAALMVGTGRGAKRGILIRDIDALQNAEGIGVVVLDKTGTVTRGAPVVSQIVPLDNSTENDLLRLAAAAEQFSEHPLAKAVLREARQRGLELPEPTGFTNEPGYGVIAKVDGRTLLVGSDALLVRHVGAGQAIAGPRAAEGQGKNFDLRFHGMKMRVLGSTLVHLAERLPDKRIERLGFIAVADEVKTDSPAAVAELHKLKLRTVLLTGDNRATADIIAKQVGIEEVHAEVKPGEKADVIKELQDVEPGTPKAKVRKVAMVGDGINDAPALAQADLGIALGSGSDIAKETGDVVLVSGSLHGVATAIRLSRATMKKIRQNLFLAFVYNVIAIPLAAFGLLNPLIAAGAMALSDISVLGNALLLRRTKID
ncbi:MAG: heavy metal translocating P-type ATPase [Tepidisphaeraceae bacterium]